MRAGVVHPMPITLRPPVQNVVLSTFSGAFTDAEFDEWLAESTRLLEEARRQRTKYVFITRSEASSAMTSRQRTRSAEWTRANTALLGVACAGQALVLAGALQRGVLTAILWMVEYPAPLKVFATEDEAREWARSQLSSDSVTARP